MCGAATFLTRDNLETVISDFRLDEVRVSRDLSPNYNLRPMQNALLVRLVDGERRLEHAQWWLVPNYEPEPRTKLTTFNARSERLLQGMFRPYFERCRALFLVDSYYEWRKEGNRRIPFRFLVDGGKHFALAALYSLWESADGSDRRLTCCVVTTRANELGESVHPRMPVILDEAAHERWLDPTNRHYRELLSLLAPFPSERMEKYQVAPLVNSPQNNSPECIRPVRSLL